MSIHIRWMIRRDLPDVLAIENDCVSPWGEDDILGLLKNRKCSGVVAEIDDRVVGYFIYRLHRHRIELLRVAVAGGQRRRGVGRALFDKLKYKAASHRRACIATTVSGDNLPAQVFFRACDMRAKSVVNGDDYRMYYLITEHDLAEHGFLSCST